MTDLRFPAPDGTIFQTRAALLCVQDGQLLTTWDERYPDFYTLPGGAIRTGESAEATALREWQEEVGEVGATVNLCATLENFFQWEGRECHEFGFFFWVKLGSPLPPTVLDNPHVSFRWLSIAELDQHTIYPVCLTQILQVPAGEIRHFVTDTRA